MMKHFFFLFCILAFILEFLLARKIISLVYGDWKLYWEMKKKKENHLLLTDRSIKLYLVVMAFIGLFLTFLILFLEKEIMVEILPRYFYKVSFLGFLLSLFLYGPSANDGSQDELTLPRVFLNVFLALEALLLLHFNLSNTFYLLGNKTFCKGENHLVTVSINSYNQQWVGKEHPTQSSYLKFNPIMLPKVYNSKHEPVDVSFANRNCLDMLEIVSGAVFVDAENKTLSSIKVSPNTINYINGNNLWLSFREGYYGIYIKDW